MNRSMLADAVDILEWLEADAGTSAQVRVERDRRIGRSISESDADFRQVLAWWDAMDADWKARVNAPQPGQRVVVLVRLATALLVLLGTIIGCSVAGVAFTYNGNYPVNLFGLLGVLVGAPFLLLVASLLLLTGHRFIPVALRDALGLLNPGRWMGAWLERHLRIGLFESVSYTPLQGVFARWQLLAFGQWLAIGYFLGVLVVAALLVVFTDLAFGWSTTIDTGSTFVWRIFHALSIPWSGWLPAAVPDRELVEASRFYRLETWAINKDRAAELGRWWPFVLMTIAVYGLLPRMVLAGVANYLVRRATRRLLEQGPKISALLDRLRTPVVTFEAGPGEASPAPMDEIPALDHLDVTGDSVVIVWDDVLQPAELEGWVHARGNEDVVTVRAAEWQSDAERRKSLDGIPRTPSRVIILTKGWEPPLLSFNDYLETLRRTVGDRPTIVIVPLDVSHRTISHAHREMWSRALASGKDAKLYVASAT